MNLIIFLINNPLKLKLMKKILLTIVAVLAAVNMNAQFYVGGSVGFGSVKPVGGGDSEFAFKILPEAGYQINDQWAAGLTLGYSKGDFLMASGTEDFRAATREVFTIAPYARYTAMDFDPIKVFFDGLLNFSSIKNGGSYFGLGVSPGIAISLTDEISFVTHLGFVGFENRSPEGSGKSGSKFGIDFRNNCSFGVYYNF